jgi:hypothetical protein
MIEPRGQVPTTSWPPPSPLGLAAELEDLRRNVIRHLDSLESLAHEGAAMPPAGVAWMEPEGVPSRELSAQLERDRKLLGEAWERLERERLELGGHRSGPPAAPRAPHGHRAEPGSATAAAFHRPAAEPSSPDPAANPAAETILRQFQTLCNDVRRTTDSRFSSH